MTRKNTCIIISVATVFFLAMTLCAVAEARKHRRSHGPDCEGAPVEKTGQTECWDEDGDIEPCTNTGQDGEIQAGVEWPVPRFTDNEDGTVTDNLTGLIWLEDANCAEGTMDWDDALTFCNELAEMDCDLSDGSIAGDWRLPNVKELQSLIDYGNYNPALPSGGSDFDSVQTFYYWSSTTYESTPGGAWCVGMYNGGVYGYGKALNQLYVWPVRAGN